MERKSSATLCCVCALFVCLCNRVGEKRESFPSELSSSIISGSLPLMMMTQLKGGVQTYMLRVCVSVTHTELQIDLHLGKNFLPSYFTSPHLLWLLFSPHYDYVGKIKDNSANESIMGSERWRRRIQRKKKMCKHHLYLRNQQADLGYSLD